MAIAPSDDQGKQPLKAFELSDLLGKENGGLNPEQATLGFFISVFGENGELAEMRYRKYSRWAKRYGMRC